MAQIQNHLLQFRGKPLDAVNDIPRFVKEIRDNLKRREEYEMKLKSQENKKRKEKEKKEFGDFDDDDEDDFDDEEAPEAAVEESIAAEPPLSQSIDNTGLRQRTPNPLSLTK
jgi:hypothetical protein